MACKGSCVPLVNDNEGHLHRHLLILPIELRVHHAWTFGLPQHGILVHLLAGQQNPSPRDQLTHRQFGKQHRYSDTRKAFLVTYPMKSMLPSKSTSIAVLRDEGCVSLRELVWPTPSRGVSSWANLYRARRGNAQSYCKLQQSRPNADGAMLRSSLHK
jgi:hypothetical protein